MSAINSSVADVFVGDAHRNKQLENSKPDSEVADAKAQQANVVAESKKQAVAAELNKKQAEKSAANEQLSSGQLEKVAQQLQDFVGEMNKGLEFLVDKDSGRDVIKVIDKTSGDLIKQYPSEEVLSLVSKLSEAAGSFINEKI